MATRAITIIANAMGSTVIEYGGNADGTGSWTALTNAVFQLGSALGTADDTRHAEGTLYSGTLVTSIDATSLTIDTYVRINSSNSQIYAVVGGPDGSEHKSYDLERFDVDRHHQARGRYA